MRHIATLMQIDMQNLFYSARDRGHKLDLEKILNHFKERETEFLTEAIVYMIRGDIRSKGFEHKLKMIGYTLRIKESLPTWKTVKCPPPYDDIIKNNMDWGNMNKRERRTMDSYLRGFRAETTTRVNHDANIIIECVDRLNTFDKLILMSGDGDFVDLMAYLKKKGKKIEIWGFKESHNAELEPYADRMQFIEESFFYQQPSVSTFGPNWGPQ